MRAPCRLCRGLHRHRSLTFWDYFADAPEIEVERPFVHTGVGYETQLVCIVHAEPVPQVIWYKDSTQLGVTEQHSQQVSARRGRRRRVASHRQLNASLFVCVCVYASEPTPPETAPAKQYTFDGSPFKRPGRCVEFGRRTLTRFMECFCIVYG